MEPAVDDDGYLNTDIMRARKEMRDDRVREKQAAKARRRRKQTEQNAAREAPARRPHSVPVGGDEQWLTQSVAHVRSLAKMALVRNHPKSAPYSGQRRRRRPVRGLEPLGDTRHQASQSDDAIKEQLLATVQDQRRKLSQLATGASSKTNRLEKLQQTFNAALESSNATVSQLPAAETKLITLRAKFDDLSTKTGALAHYKSTLRLMVARAKSGAQDGKKRSDDMQEALATVTNEVATTQTLLWKLEELKAAALQEKETTAVKMLESGRERQSGLNLLQNEVKGVLALQDKEAKAELTRSAKASQSALVQARARAAAIGLQVRVSTALHIATLAPVVYLFAYSLARM